MSKRPVVAHRAGNRRTRGRRAPRGGFTLIEVMIAMTLLVGGTIAIVQMQRVALRAVTVSRELGTATQIAHNALEQLKLDALTWTQPALDENGALVADLSPANLFGRTLWLHKIGTPFTWQVMSFPELAGWAPPAGTNMTAGPASDFFGRNVGSVADFPAEAHYCTHIRLTWVQIGRSMRADVRVFSRDTDGNGGALTTEITADCVDVAGALDPGGALENAVHMVYASTVIRMTEPAF